MLSPRRTMIQSLFIGSLLLFALGSAKAQTVADSVADFSGVQGQNSWYYGYYDRSHDADALYNPHTDFLLMPQFSIQAGWQTQDGTYWDYITATDIHPNGTTTSGGRQSIEHWAIRRWVSTVSGGVTLTGEFAKTNISGGNGVLGHIFVDGTEVWNQYLTATDSAGTNYAVNVTLQVGSKVDFVLDPYQYNDLADSTKFTGKVTRRLVTIGGTITLQGTQNLAQPVDFTFRPTSGSAFTRTVTLDAGGGYSINNVPAVQYTVSIKGAKWLRKNITVDARNGNVTNASATLLAGDANNDNAVDVADLLLIINHYNQTQANTPNNYLEGADFNSDGTNDVSDLLTVIGNYNRLGDS